MTKWYLNRDPLLTTEHIVRNKCHDGWSHKDVMKLIHLHSTEPCNLIYKHYEYINFFYFIFYYYTMSIIDLLMIQINFRLYYVHCLHFEWYRKG